MEQPIIMASIVCPSCGVAVDAGSQLCAGCGAPVSAISEGSRGARLSTADRPGPSSARSVIDNRWQLLLLLFGATGVLGVPLLWNSRAFGPLGKLAISLLVTAWTAVLMALCWWSWSWTTDQLKKIW